MSDHPQLLITLTGPTGIGKTALSIKLARELQTEIVSCDSRQFFHELRIGTASPSPDELAAVPHHFIGSISIQESYNVHRYETDALERLEGLFRKYRQVILTGGSGLYLHAITHGIDDLPDPDPTLREHLKQQLAQHGIRALQDLLKEKDPGYFKEVDLSNPKRILRALEVCLTTGLPYSLLRTKTPHQRFFRIRKIGLTRPRNELYTRINQRVDGMIANGLIEEARQMLPFRHLNALNTVGYKELFDYFDGNCTLEQAVGNIKTHSRRYAKRQMTWFSKDPGIRWFHPDDYQQILHYCLA